MKTEKNRIWNYNKDIELENCGEGVARKILAYTDELMCVENHFKKGGIGAMHHHPHTQITYVVSGQFEFTIGDEKKIVKAGDSLLKKDGIEHGCVCLEEGILLDIFNPMREDFVKQENSQKADAAAQKNSQKADAAAQVNRQEGIDPQLMAFFDTDDLEEKYNILVSMRDIVDNRMIDNMAVGLDIVIPDGQIDARYEELIKCIRTQQKYESDRLRR